MLAAFSANNVPDNPLFVSKRLGCRRWLPGDLPDIYQVYSDKEGARWVGDGLPITYAECEHWMDVTLENYAKRGYGMFTVFDLSNKEIVGFCGLVHPDGQPEVEIKYAFYRECWGKGYASEVVPEMLGYAASAHGVTTVIATVAEENTASQRVLEKSHMLHIRTLEEADGAATRMYEWRCIR